MAATIVIALVVMFIVWMFFELKNAPTVSADGIVQNKEECDCTFLAILISLLADSE